MLFAPRRIIARARGVRAHHLSARKLTVTAIPIVARHHRLFSSSNNHDNDKNSEIKDYLTSLGIRLEFQQDVLQTLQPLLLVGNGTNSNGGNEISVSNLKASISQEDLIELSKSIELQATRKIIRPQKKQRPSLQVLFSHSTTQQKTLTWRYGESLLDLAQGNEEMLLSLEEGLHEDDQRMEGSCGGTCSCSTCHVYLDDTTWNALPPATETELDMLDLAFEPKETSRLGCQVKLSDHLIQQLDSDHVIQVTLPSGVNNHWEV